jgi:DNA mismatch endonuclease Vsr
MSDHLTKEQRSKNMKAVTSKDSKIELLLRKELWHCGYRYRKHYKKIPGKPDIAFPSKKTAIFCDSEFWHGKDWEEKKHEIKSNKVFWYKKIERNMERDREVNKALKDLEWTVLRFCGDEIKNNLHKCVKTIEKELNQDD